MTTYRLKDEGLSFKKIYTGRKWVGRVVKHATEPCYLGFINANGTRIEAAAPTERLAFEAVVAKRLGFDSAPALHQHNREVRAHNRAVNAQAKAALNAMLRREFGPVLDIIESMGRR